MSEPAQPLSPQEKRIEEMTVDFEVNPQHAESQQIVSDIALSTIPQTEENEEVSADFVAKPLEEGDHSVADKVDSVAVKSDALVQVSSKPPEKTKETFPPIKGEKYNFSSRQVEKIMMLLTQVSGQNRRTSERKEDDKKRVLQSAIKEDVEKRRALLREVRNFLKKEDTKDYHEDMEIVEELSYDDFVELSEAFSQMQEDKILYQGMKTLLEGRIESEGLGKPPA